MKWTIGTKLLGIFGAAIFCLVFASVIAFRQTTEMIDASNWVVHTHTVLSTIERLTGLLTETETGQRGYIITGEDRYLEPYEIGVKSIDSTLMQLKSLISDNPIQVQRVENLATLIPKRMGAMKEGITLRKSDFESSRKFVMTDTGKTFMDEIRKIALEMESTENQLLKQRDLENKDRAEASKYAIILGILLCLFVFIFSAFFIVMHIARPLKQISTLADQISVGDLDVKVPDQQRGDEIGVLISAFNKMLGYFNGMAKDLTEISKRNLTVKVKPESDKDVIGNSLINMVTSLRSITSELKDGASVLASSTGEILAVVSQVSSGASETAAAVSETTATVEEVKQTALASNQRAKGVSENAKLAAEISQTGKSAVDASIDGMRQIQKRMESITENIMKLSEQGQTIGEIISAVNDLAEQSNLLAVNASIEAARAGEQGRGFMIVAQEVKILADQSKQATAQVRAILNEIQKATSAAVLAAEQGSKAVESGMTQVEQSGKSILALNERVVQAAQAAIQIAASSEQQVAGVTQVATAMENIKQASSQNVSGTKQVEQAAQNLNKVGQNLKSLVELFSV